MRRVLPPKERPSSLNYRLVRYREKRVSKTFTQEKSSSYHGGMKTGRKILPTLPLSHRPANQESIPTTLIAFSDTVVCEQLPDVSDLVAAGRKLDANGYTRAAPAVEKLSELLNDGNNNSVVNTVNHLLVLTDGRAPDLQQALDFAKRAVKKARVQNFLALR